MTPVAVVVHRLPTTVDVQLELVMVLVAVRKNVSLAEANQDYLFSAAVQPAREIVVTPVVVVVHRLPMIADVQLELVMVLVAVRKNVSLAEANQDYLFSAAVQPAREIVVTPVVVVVHRLPMIADVHLELVMVLVAVRKNVSLAEANQDYLFSAAVQPAREIVVTPVAVVVHRLPTTVDVHLELVMVLAAVRKNVSLAEANQDYLFSAAVLPAREIVVTPVVVVVHRLPMIADVQLELVMVLAAEAREDLVC